jgi:hypothetical protein
MIYKAKDGKLFGNSIQGRKYDSSLAEKSERALAGAPGGPSHEEAFRLHGAARHIELDIEDGGRFHVTTKHADGFTYEGVHPQAHVAHDVVGHLIGVNPPMAIETHARARSQPVGEKEKQRLDREDSRSEETNE